MNKDNYTRELVESAIILHFGIKQPKIKCAGVLGITQSTLSRNLKKLTPAFIQRLKGVGIVFDNPTVKEKEIEYAGMTLVKQVKLLEETNERLETELKKLVYQLKQFRKDCDNKEDCLIKNMTLGDKENN
ncbi:MAG TPA: hypothetical protein ENH82_00105 [bacterium]|nr:hypothetical protein [bacterium]